MRMGIRTSYREKEKRAYLARRNLPKILYSCQWTQLLCPLLADRYVVLRADVDCDGSYLSQLLSNRLTHANLAVKLKQRQIRY